MKKLILFLTIFTGFGYAMEGGEKEVPSGEGMTIGEFLVTSNLQLQDLPTEIIIDHMAPYLSPKERGRFLIAMGKDYLGFLQDEKDRYLTTQIQKIIGSWNKSAKVKNLLEEIKNVNADAGFQMLKQLKDAMQGVIIVGGRLTLPELQTLQEIVRMLTEKGAGVKQEGQKLDFTDWVSILAYYKKPDWDPGVMSETKQEWLQEFEIAYQIIKQFIDAGVDVNVQNKDSDTALMLAASHDNPDVVQMLLDAGADITLTNNKGQAAIDFAQTDKIKQMLLKKQEE